MSERYTPREKMAAREAYEKELAAAQARLDAFLDQTGTEVTLGSHPEPDSVKPFVEGPEYDAWEPKKYRRTLTAGPLRHWIGFIVQSNNFDLFDAGQQAQIKQLFPEYEYMPNSSDQKKWIFVNKRILENFKRVSVDDWLGEENKSEKET